MPLLKELVAYLTVERLYKEKETLPDGSVIEGRQTIRTILVIDASLAEHISPVRLTCMQ